MDAELCGCELLAVTYESIRFHDLLTMYILELPSVRKLNFTSRQVVHSRPHRKVFHGHSFHD